jgi:polyisoprenoid-binding protein YceI
MAKGKLKWIVGGAVAAVAVGALGGAALYFSMVSTDAPTKASIDDAVASISSSQTDSSGQAASTGTSSDDLAGTWVVAPGSETFVGYRVKEELAGFGTFTAVGRTQDVEATLTYDGSAITQVQVTADLTGLASDNSMRDGQLGRQGLQTDTYPTATFVLTKAIELGGAPENGETVQAMATGDLTLHGVTRSIDIPLEGQFTNGYAVVVGSLDVNFADYGIEKPSSARVLGMEDHGVMELQLVLQQASTNGG